MDKIVKLRSKSTAEIEKKKTYFCNTQLFKICITEIVISIECRKRGNTLLCFFISHSSGVKTAAKVVTVREW